MAADWKWDAPPQGGTRAWAVLHGRLVEVFFSPMAESGASKGVDGRWLIDMKQDVRIVCRRPTGDPFRDETFEARPGFFPFEVAERAAAVDAGWDPPPAEPEDVRLKRRRRGGNAFK